MQAQAQPSLPTTRRRKPFPSLLITPVRFEAQGSFAEAQAAFLEPDPSATAALRELLTRTGVGVVAHFYMDAELQGTLAACGAPHIHVADSLQMADRALKMAAAGARAIIVLGVDFMSENVRAMLDASGFAHVPVYRPVTNAIGCSLAESAETRMYEAYLTRAARMPRSLHVIYVNTSLRTKARAQRLLPTLTCTSSNVLSILLQAYAQVPDLNVWFGPDTYMGRNLSSLLHSLSRMDAEQVRALHPAHTPQSLAAAHARFHFFEQGVCIVHHMFGDAVAAQVQRDYADAFITAHLEVPGEMFDLAFAAQQRGRGVVGSTSNILDFIASKLDAAIAARTPGRLRFILGTEAGMITPIARSVQQKLRALVEGGGPEIAVEIVFPVAAEAIATTDDVHLPVVPGVSGGEGCTTAGGCATCPYMKMSSLDALLALLARIDSEPAAALAGYAPKQYTAAEDGASIVELGTRSILRMREFQAQHALPAELVAAITRE